MDLQDARAAIEAAEPHLGPTGFVVAATFERDGRRLDVAITDRLRRACRKARVWNSPALLTAFKNAGYGFDEARARSPGGSDGIFVITREHRPPNAMMKKLFDRYLDRPGSGAQELAADLGTTAERLIPVRLVSHHLRLLGVLHREAAREARAARAARQAEGMVSDRGTGDGKPGTGSRAGVELSAGEYDLDRSNAGVRLLVAGFPGAEGVEDRRRHGCAV